MKGQERLPRAQPIKSKKMESPCLLRYRNLVLKAWPLARPQSALLLSPRRFEVSRKNIVLVVK